MMVNSFENEQMQLYDVAFSSLIALEAQSLSLLAEILDRDDESMLLHQRAKEMRNLIAEHLWNKEIHTFCNKFPNGTFYERITPTSFYALLAQAATDTQADALVNNWLMNPNHFCISETWPAGVNNTCYWGLPSINAADPAFPPLGYWRGFVWGPMAQLTYWSLLQYDHVPSVRAGRKALCKQMTEMGMKMWREHRHICENFSPHQDASDCTGTVFYHWGGLTMLISLLEAGY